MAFWVYMRECADGSDYVGHPDDLEKRMAGHVSGELGGYTATRRPVRLVFTQDCSSRDAAWSAERQIKGWSRKKKQALIGGDWAEISRLASRRTPFPAG
jgi:predicted GIY-YIG superfamily endonuclease